MTLEELYEAAWEDNVFFAEYEGLTAAGDVRDLTWLAEHADPPTTPEELLPELMATFMGAIVDLCVLGEAKGEDRVANCQSAWDRAKEEREKGNLPRVVAIRESLGLAVHDPHRLGTF